MEGGRGVFGGGFRWRSGEGFAGGKKFFFGKKNQKLSLTGLLGGTDLRSAARGQVTAMSSQPNWVTLAVSFWRRTMVVVGDSMMAGPGMVWAGARESRS